MYTFEVETHLHSQICDPNSGHPLPGGFFQNRWPWRAAMAHDAVRARGALTRWLWPWLVFVQVFAQDAAVVIPRQIPRRVGITNHAPTPGAWVVHEVKMYFTETWTLLRGWGGCCCFVFFFFFRWVLEKQGIIRRLRMSFRV